MPPSVTDLDSFTQALETAGFTVRVGEQQNESLFTVAAQPVSIDGVRVTAFEYPSEDALDDVRALIGGDGYSVPMRDGGIAHVDWVAAPHLFNAGRVMVLYVGDEEGTLEALKLVLGKQFAGA